MCWSCVQVRGLSSTKWGTVARDRNLNGLLWAAVLNCVLMIQITNRILDIQVMCTVHCLHCCVCFPGPGPRHHHQPGAQKAVQQLADRRSLQQQVRWLWLHRRNDTQTLQWLGGRHGEKL